MDLVVGRELATTLLEHLRDLVAGFPNPKKTDHRNAMIQLEQLCILGQGRLLAADDKLTQFCGTLRQDP
jgi:hypothetical protein